MRNLDNFARSARPLAYALSVLAGTTVAAGDVRHLTFEWPNPALSTPCELRDAVQPGIQADRRFKGTVEREGNGTVCSVQIPRPRFDRLYGFCGVEYAQNEPRDYYGCFVHYFPRSVRFSYSYSSEFLAAPRCAFVCTGK